MTPSQLLALIGLRRRREILAILCLSILFLMALASFSAVYSQTEGAEGESQGHKVAEPIPLLGLGPRVEPGTELHVLQALVILVLAGLNHLASRLSDEQYVRSWALAWAILLAYYCFQSFEGFLHTFEIRESILAKTVEIVLFTGSTFYILKTGLTGGPGERLGTKCQYAIAYGFIAQIIVLTTISCLLGQPVFDAIAHANASLACVCTVYAGVKLQRRTSSLDVSPAFLGGREVFPVFATYGILQLGSAWIHTEPSWRMALYSAALVLKIPCSLSVVAIAFRETFKLSENRRIESSNRQVELKESNEHLSLALEAAETSKQLTELRKEGLERIGSILSEERRSWSAMAQIVAALHDLFSLRGVTLLIQVPGAESEKSLYRSISAGIQVPSVLSVETLDDGRPSVESLRRLLEENVPAPSIQQFPIPLDSVSGSAWLCTFERGHIEPLSGSTDVMEELVKRSAAAIEVSGLREISDLSKRANALAGEFLDVRELLDAYAKLGSAVIGAQTLIIEIEDASSQASHRGYYRPANLSRSSKAEDKSNIKDFSPMPSKTQWAWYPPEIVDSEKARSVIRVPFSNGRDIRGIVTAADKISPGEVVAVPFSELEIPKLEVIGAVSATAVEREMRSQNIERLVAQNIHELRQSVSGLRQVVRWLGRHLKPKEETKLWRKLSDAETDIRSLKLIVDSVDIYQEEQEEQPEEVMIFRDIVMKAGAELRERLQRFGIPIGRQSIDYVRVKSIPPLTLPKSHLQHIVLNLTNNAFKYRDREMDEFRLIFEGDSDRDYYLLHVKDWGVGVPSGWKERIFVDGERAPNAVQATYPGRGMGLSIARTFAKKLGGNVVLNQRKSPTTFTVKLPKDLKM